MKDRIQELFLQAHQGQVDSKNDDNLDEDMLDYISSAISEASTEEEVAELVSSLSFVGETNAASSLVKQLMNLLNKEGSDDELKLSPTTTKKADDEKTTGEFSPHPSDTATSSSEDDRSRHEEEESKEQKKARRKQERERKKAERKAAQHQKKKGSKKKEEAVDEFVDDDVTAWKDCQAAGQTWGGRGFGGRGVRSEVNTAQNLHLPNVTLQYAGNELLQSSLIQINGGHRYGLIGRNGVGKSTLMKRLAAHMIPGTPAHMRILLVNQQIAGSETKNALQTLVEADVSSKQLLEEQAKLEEMLEGLATSPDQEDAQQLETIVQRLEEIAVELDAASADRAEERAKSILKGLQFTKDMIEGPTCNLSGGWRMRLALAQALFVPSDLLLLDEPSNHIDIRGLMWLSDYLQNKLSDKTAVVIVSHDRMFLNICTDIITMEHKKLHYHPGNYEEYERHQQEKASFQSQKLNASEKQRQKALAFIQKQQKATADPKKQRQAKMIKEKKLDRIGNYREDGKRYQQFSLAKMDMSTVRLAQKVHIEADDPVIRMKFPEPVWAPNMTEGGSLMTMQDVNFGYDKKKDFLLKDMTLDVSRGNKIALVGGNGEGKSTCLKLLTGEIDDKKYRKSGSIWRHPNLRVGHVSQYSVEQLEEDFADLTVVEYAEQELRKGTVSSDVIQKASGNVRQYLGSFGLGGNALAHRRIGKLSGGERMRLCFATVLAEQPQLLVLDEPTNHLDLETLDALSAALHDYKGTVLIVSHNQGFLRGFCQELWVVENGHVEIHRAQPASSSADNADDASSAAELFDEMFSNFRNHTLMGGGARAGRSKQRQVKATMARTAARQRTGAKQGTGFIS